MNILVPYTWLLEHLETDASPEEIQHDLSLCGPSVERIYQKEGEPVFDIEVTTNRVDSASVLGIAREAAAILPEFDQQAKLKDLDISTSKTNHLPKLDIEIINDPNICHRILAVKLSHVTTRPSPKWIQKRLLQVDQRPLNNLIDITNYCMWEIGHPIHAFDYDLITTKKIIVREAKKGESFITLDQKSHTCLGGEVIFDDGTGNIIDLPGIMGTQNTVVNDSTKNILLWIESVDAKKIRQASMGLAIRSQAAVLNEKQVDPELAMVALKRAIHLYETICQAKIDSQILDIYPHPRKPLSTTLKTTKLDNYLGISIPPKRIQRILENLSISVTPQPKGYLLTPPTWRLNDLIIPEDYIEEIARIYGYHNLPSVIMPTPIPHQPSTEDFKLEAYLKSCLVGWGLTEVYTYSMISSQMAKESNSPLDDHLKIKNPLSKDWVYLRTSLIPSLCEVLDQNPTHTTTIFEMQNVYLKNSKSLPTERLDLAIVSPTTGTGSFRSLAGTLSAIMARLYLQDYHIKPVTTVPKPYLKNSAGEIWVDQVLVGYIGEVKTKTLNRFALHLFMEKIQQLKHTHPHALTQALHPPVIEDLTLTLPPHTAVGPVIDSIRGHDSLIESVVLKEIYHQNYTFTLIYRSSTQSLNTDDIAPIRLKIVDSLHKKYSAILVGQLPH